MKPYTRQDIENIYGDLMMSAHNNYARYRLADALNDIETAANWAYNFNHIYTDKDAEQLLMQIGDMAVEPVQIEMPKSDLCVLIDSFLLDNRGLSQQYLRAMMANNMHIIVVYTNAGGSIGKDTFSELKAYDKAEIASFTKGIDKFEEAKQIVKLIKAFSPAHIFLHLTPWDTVALMACHAIKGPKVYQINLTDHAYWLGARFIDYSLEFRPYGMTVSLEKRGLRREQILGLPYYPITPVSADFAGLPDMPDDAVKVFTGGSLYKMLGKDDIFFRIMENILEIAPNVYIMVAGFNHDNRFDGKVSRIKGKERVLQIGIRRDIDAVFEHCDIYLGTYPMAGGLMSQYAAKHSRPIIAYHDEGDVMNEVEEMVNYYNRDFHSFTSLKEMSCYAERLVRDVVYRKEQGRSLHNAMMNEERFNSAFMATISEQKSLFQWSLDKIDYDSFFDRYLDLENSNGFCATKSLIRTQKLAIFSKVKGYNKNKIEAISYAVKNCSPHRLFLWLLSHIIHRKR